MFNYSIEEWLLLYSTQSSESVDASCGTGLRFRGVINQAVALEVLHGQLFRLPVTVKSTISQVLLQRPKWLMCTPKQRTSGVRAVIVISHGTSGTSTFSIGLVKEHMGDC
jgi:hypothetical protein